MYGIRCILQYVPGHDQLYLEPEFRGHDFLGQYDLFDYGELDNGRHAYDHGKLYRSGHRLSDAHIGQQGSNGEPVTEPHHHGLRYDVPGWDDHLYHRGGHGIIQLDGRSGRTDHLGSGDQCLFSKMDTARHPDHIGKLYKYQQLYGFGRKEHYCLFSAGTCDHGTHFWMCRRYGIGIFNGQRNDRVCLECNEWRYYHPAGRHE